jgi:hypothetical protein
MAITLDGTAGITTPEIISTAGPVVVDASAPDNSLVVAANGNVGIGSSSPSGKLEVNTGSSVAYFTRTAGDTGVTNTAIGIGTASTTTRLGSSGDLQFMVGAVGTAAISQTEKMRIDSAGNVMIGTTSPGNSRLSVANASGNTVNISVTNTNRTDQYLTLNVMGATGFGVTGWDDSSVIEAVAAGTATGTKALYLSAYNGPIMLATNNRTERVRIYADGTVGIFNLAGAGSRTVTAGSGGVLAAASDSRLKQEVPTAPIPGLAEIMQLEPRAYKWIDDIEKRGEDAAVEIGFFANDVKHIIPSAAPMGNDGYYGFYDRAVIAALTKAVQEQQKMIQDLQADIAALKLNTLET